MRVHAHVHGLVQGVSFRYFVLSAAKRLTVTGWVRNRSDGSVEFVAEGPRDDLDSLIDACRKGPPMARVDRLDAQWENEQASMSDFQIRF
ncbi:MAG: acylphosphatase [Deltaproteobacteria bacterium]|nr:acylphosphatase [Deltaproteobacteria bacterium]